MFLSLASNIVFIVALIVVVTVVVLSIIFINTIRRDFKKLYRARSRFHIEIRKIVNLIYNIHKSKKLEQYTKVVIKNLSHDDKLEVIKAVDNVFETLDKEDRDNKYIIETYNRLYILMEERDKLLEDFNNLIKFYPHKLYARFMKLPEYEYYTNKD